ncbi:hypothetical protein L484_019929 [Morus notabilis]|uniref:S-protein homolog n=1 Tax=Morus notabilis TaxID=981085 RepID=W9RH60_9ROSA|nr:S-protein homolog 6 [Morus notabilis]EXB54797.1 hypothetical protein L484_019929 [Morus notabilis]
MNIQSGKQTFPYFSLLLMISSIEASTVDDRVQTNNNGSEPDNIFEPPRTTVRIYNNLEDGTQLSVHCKSKDDDLGPHNLANSQSYDWKFRVNYMGTTLFFCGLTSLEATGTFTIFDAERDEARCQTNCNWRVKRDGVHGYTEAKGIEDIFFPWPKFSLK